MSMSDPISDMLTRIRNAHSSNKLSVTMYNSKVKASIAKVLEEEGYIVNYMVTQESQPKLIINLKYFNGKPVINKLSRVSRPGLRKYYKCNELPRVMDGLGTAIVSTSKGVMSDFNAKLHGFGGEVLCIIL